jgi:uncharacterized protein YutE (UPF0331/DUF86 family)
MYGPDMDRFNRRLSFLRELCARAESVNAARASGVHPEVVRLATERAVHVAAECVTDIGSDLLDWFIMRDAASYEDIVDILHGEGLFSEELYAWLRELALMRKPLVQQYDAVDADKLASLTAEMPVRLPEFAEAVAKFADKEMEIFRAKP